MGKKKCKNCGGKFDQKSDHKGVKLTKENFNSKVGVVSDVGTIASIFTGMIGWVFGVVSTLEKWRGIAYYDKTMEYVNSGYCKSCAYDKARTLIYSDD